MAASPRVVGAVRPASRPRTPAWLPRASTPPRIAGLPLRTPSLRLTLPAERLGPPTELLRLGLLLIAERLLLDERLGLLLIDERLGLDERLELLLKLLRLELLLEEWLLPEERLLLTELLCPPPPPRLPPLRCARAGVALSARAIIASAITFEVFILLLLSFLVVLSLREVRSTSVAFFFCCKSTTFLRGNFRNLYLFFPFSRRCSRE